MGLISYAAILVSVTGCASIAGHGAPHPGFSQAYGCDHTEIMAYRKAHGTPEVPRVGWSACDVLKRYGMPRDVDVQETGAGRSVSWWFPDPLIGMQDPKLVTLTEGAAGWTVVYVGWS